MHVTIHWSHGWGLAAQILTIWIIVALIASPWIGKYLRGRRAQAEFKKLLETERKARLERLRLNLVRADAEVERRARAVVLPIGDEKFRERARRAEALGFCDDDYPNYPRAS